MLKNSIFLNIRALGKHAECGIQASKGDRGQNRINSDTFTCLTSGNFLVFPAWLSGYAPHSETCYTQQVHSSGVRKLAIFGKFFPLWLPYFQNEAPILSLDHLRLNPSPTCLICSRGTPFPLSWFIINLLSCN